MTFSKLVFAGLVLSATLAFADKDDVIAGAKDDLGCKSAKSDLEDIRKTCNDIRKKDGSSSFKYKLCLKRQDAKKEDAQEACSKKNTRELKKERKEAEAGEKK